MGILDMADKITEDSLIIKKPKVFNNPDYVPENIYESDNTKLISKDIANFVVHSKAFNKIIVGRKGVGKTVNLCYLKDSFNEDEDVKNSLKEQNSNLVLYVDCKTSKSVPQIMKQLMIEGGVIFKKKESILSQFKEFYKNKKLVIILDEVDLLNYDPRTKNSIFNALCSINSSSVDFSLILITNDVQWLDEYRLLDLDFDAKVHFRNEDKINWGEPKAEDILEILKLRVKEGVKGDVDENILFEIANLTYSKYHSNIRDALPTLYSVLDSIIKGKNFNIMDIMEEKHKGNILNTLISLRDSELIILLIATQFESSSDILTIYNIISEQVISETGKFSFSKVSKPTFCKTYNKLGELKNLISLHRGTSRRPDGIKLLVEQRLVNESILKKSEDEDYLKNCLKVLKNYKEILEEKKRDKNKSLLDN